MYALLLTARRVVLSVCCAAAFSTVLLAAAAPATAQPGTVRPGTAQPGTVQPGTVRSAATASSRSCNFGQPKGVPLVVLQTRGTQTSAPKNYDFGFTGPYNLVARKIVGPFATLYNYSNCRVWLHGTAGRESWSTCFDPRRLNTGDSPAFPIPARDEFADNIMISGNPNRC
jgi:hypothetical protein